jgi:hypothetical protein
VGVGQRPAGVVGVLGQRHRGTHLAAPVPVEAGIDHHPVQPGGHRSLAPVRAGVAVGRQQRVLKRVCRLLAVARGAQRHGPEPVAVALDQDGERLGVARDVRGEQRAVVDRPRAIDRHRVVGGRGHGGGSLMALRPAPEARPGRAQPRTVMPAMPPW